MYIKTSLNLDIQTQCLDILCDFLDAEHEAIQYGQIYDLYPLAKSIHGLLKLLRAKREELTGNLMGVSVRDFVSELPGYLGDPLYGKLDRLAKLEQKCLDKTSRNADLALALSGRTQAMLDLWNVSSADRTATGKVQ
ncbi:MAG: flagellar protein FlgN [Deltaproteobacteria bacterium]|jgi:hypothetical protein|nr:flagellar protein FlgN [Deltaproteobacteria bacterium]